MQGKHLYSTITKFLLAILHILPKIQLQARTENPVGSTKQTEPSLVALYDIRPGNAAGLCLQPGARSPLRHRLPELQRT